MERAFTVGWGQGSVTSLDTSVPAGTSPWRGHFVLKVENDGAQGSNSQLFTRCLPANIDKNSRDKKAMYTVCVQTHDGRHFILALADSLMSVLCLYQVFNCLLKTFKKKK